MKLSLIIEIQNIEKLLDKQSTIDLNGMSFKEK